MSSLKTELGLGEPKPAGSTEQADQFKAAFQAAIGSVNQSLQYTAAHAEQAKHDPHASKRDTTCSAYQIALGRIDPTNPAAAQAAIDQVLAGVNSVKSAAESLKKSVEKAFNTWTGKQPLLDDVSDKIREMVDWGHQKASALEQVVKAVTEKANQRAWEAASTALDQIVDKVKPLYEEFLKQKAAKEEYDPLLAATQPRLEKVHACTFKSLESQKQAITAAEAPMNEAAAAMDFVTALTQLKALEALLSAFEAELAQLEAKKQQYDEARAAIDGKLTDASTCEYKVLAEMDQQIADLTSRTDQAAADEDFDQAITLVGELGCKVDEKLARVAELDAKRTEYEQKRAEVDAKLGPVSTCEYKVLAELDQQIVDLTGRVDQAATEQEYDQAIQLLGELLSKVDEKAQRVAELDAKKADYESAKASATDKMDSCTVSARQFTSLDAARADLAAKHGEMIAAAEDQDYDKALAAAKDLDSKSAKYLADAEKEQAKYDKKGADIVKKIDDAGYFSEDNVAREEMAKLTEDDLKHLPTEARNRILAELQEGYFSDDDKVAAKKLYSVKYLDPEFEKIDQKNRREMLEKLKTDPKYKEARDNWSTWPDNKKLETLQSVADVQADAYGIPKTTIETYTRPPYTDPDSGISYITNGEYGHDDGKLMLNDHPRSAWRDFDKVLNTTVHENGHRYQSTLIDRLDDGTLKKGDPLYNQAMTFKLNDTHHGYYTFDKPEYFTQPQETHSRVTGDALENAKIGQ